MHAGENDAEYFILALILEKKRCLLVSFIMKPLICNVSHWSISQFISWMMRSFYGPVSWLSLHFIVCSFSNEEKDEHTCMKKFGDLRIICKPLFQAGLAEHSFCKKKREEGGRARQEKPLKFLNLWKMVMLFNLMADKHCLPVTWTECRRAICVSKLSRLQDWKAQDSKSNNYLHFLESAHGAASCRMCLAVVPECWAHSGDAASSCLPIQANHNSTIN